LGLSDVPGLVVALERRMAINPTTTLWTRRIEQRRGSRAVPIFAGIGLVLHGLAHAVFPLRGAGSGANWIPAKIVIELAWILAMTGFVAGGFGLAGARPLRRFWRSCVAAAVLGSAIVFATVRQLELLPVLVFDVLALAALYRWTNVAEDARSSLIVPSTRWRRVRSVAGGGVALVVTAFIAMCALSRSWHSQWGVTNRELALAFPGDRPERDAAFEVNHGITINAPPTDVWPWLVQLGRDRAGFYSYDALENLVGLRIHNADRIHDEWQNRSVGDLVPATPPGWLGLSKALGWKISHLEPERAIVLAGWGAFVLKAVDEGHCRLFVRSTVTGPKVPVWAAALSFATFEPIHFVMERRMLLGIKARAEMRGEPWPEVSRGAAIAGH
jgi:hypothetical protein